MMHLTSVFVKSGAFRHYARYLGQQGESMNTFESDDELDRVQEETLKAHELRVKFNDDLRAAIKGDQHMLNRFEFFTAVLELHPTFDFEHISFGSELLDARRALAYHIVARQLGHARSLIANANIKNRVGTGASLRCMLEMTAFAEFFGAPQTVNDHRLIDLYLHGQAFLGGSWATGSWYELEEEWREKYSEPLPSDAREFFKKMFGLPRGSDFLGPMASNDEGFSYLYSRYSEFIHPAFVRSRDDLEAEIGHPNPHSLGSREYLEHEFRLGAPTTLILRDIDVGQFCLRNFCRAAMPIDPHFDKQLRPQVIERVKRDLELLSKQR